ncbi:MAG: fluoride efflux transporter CrcB [Acidimicrobiia bacterium]
MSAFGWIAFVIAAACGAPLRYVVDNVVQDRTRGAFPWGTLTINATGSFLSGVVAGLTLHHGLAPGVRVVVATGFLGAFTTFSTFVFETVRLLEEGAVAEAVRNAMATVVVCATAAAAGLALASV